MAHWSLNDIPWHSFDPSKVDPAVLPLIKAASLVEYNSHDYTRYLNEVFHDDPEFRAAADEWAEEEIQHGKALQAWAEHADPAFSFDKSFRSFTEGYQLPQNVTGSVRGSRSGELISRCIVETGTSGYYTAIMEHTDEPALKFICSKIAADELRHYKLFYTHLQRYLKKENIGVWKRLFIVLGRVFEVQDDELSYAFYAGQNASGNTPARAYDRKRYKNLYFDHVCRVYRQRHIERMTAMAFKAVGLKPHTWLHRAITALAWTFISRRAASVTINYPEFQPAPMAAAA